MWKRRTKGRDLGRAVRIMSEARSRAEGVFVQEWSVREHPSEFTSEAIVRWCQDVLARCRRPFGIDHFDLALAFADPDSGPTSRLFRLRAADLYNESLADQVAAFLFGRPAAQPAQVAAALFSWGDAAHRALPPEA